MRWLDQCAVVWLPVACSPTSRLRRFEGHSASRPAGASQNGGERDRTDDLLLAKQALSQLSYTPLGASRFGGDPPRLCGPPSH